jgi:hypothetical protein
MDLILYGDIFCHNIIHHLDLKGLSKLKCVCKRYNHIITQTLNQLAINDIKSELNNYDVYKNILTNGKKCNNHRYYIIRIELYKFHITNDTYDNYSDIGILWIGLNGFLVKGLRRILMIPNAKIYITSIPFTNNIAKIKYKIYNTKEKYCKYYFIDDSIFEL